MHRGSMSASKQMLDIAEQLNQMGHQTTLPRGAEKYAGGKPGETSHESIQNKIDHDLIRHYYNEIKKGDAILVVNADKNNIKNYIGGNSFLEMGFAHVLNKKIFLLNDIPETSYADEIKAMRPIVLGGDLSKIS
ncbi:MAG TPA: hypothetical protein VMX18_04775 [Candidatus Bipolaricaulota bacterium]|nr:hypothetical protein [Candidatus Bipolaricaulota bacterium]